MKYRTIVVCLLMCLVGMEAKAYDFATRLSNGDSLFFNVTDASARQVCVVSPSKGGTNYYYGHQQPSGTVVIPAEVEYNGQQYTVTAIGDRAFAGCTKIQLVIMPETVESIGAYAFYGCTGMKILTIGVNVNRIGVSAFYGCTFLAEVHFRARECSSMGVSMSSTVFGNCRSLRKVVIDEGVRIIPDYAFCGVDALSDSIELPSTLRRIGDYAFAYCSSLNDNLVIPDSVETIGECAYHQCHSLKSLTLGSSVRSIGGRAFYHCIGMKRVTVKSFIPAEIALTSFSEISKTAKLRVPCVSKKLYEKHSFWKKVALMETYGKCTFTINGAMDTAVSGMVVGGGEYAFGDSVSLMAVCAAGYGFDGWTDGNLENPRRFVAMGSASFTATTRPSGTVTIVDTLYLVDTVYAEGYKVIHDTVDLVDVAKTINDVKEVTFDTEKKRLKWNFPRKETVVNVSLYNQIGVCVYSGDSRKGNINMRRLPSGFYIVRIETVRRVIRCRFFINADRTWSGIDREMSIQ